MASTSMISVGNPVPRARRIAVLAFAAALAVGGIVLTVAGLILIVGGEPAGFPAPGARSPARSYAAVEATGSTGRTPALRPSLDRE